MKKIFIKKQIWLRRKIKSNARRNKFMQKDFGTTSKSKIRKEVTKNTEEIYAPIIFFTGIVHRKDRAKLHEKFKIFIDDILKSSANNLHINLKAVEEASPSGMLLFKATLDYSININKKTVTLTPSATDKINQVIKQTGIANLVKTEAFDCELEHEDVIHWRAIEGPYGFFDTDKISVYIDDEKIKKYYLLDEIIVSINEAINNSTEHAYKNSWAKRKFGMNEANGWWSFAQVKDEKLTVCVLDLGQGFHRSMNASFPQFVKDTAKTWLSLPSQNRDSIAIRASNLVGRTSTGQPGRGRGMDCAHKVVNLSDEGVFRVLSHSGLYTYTRTQSDDPNSGKIRSKRTPHDWGVTCYQWDLPLRRHDSE